MNIFLHTLHFQLQTLNFQHQKLVHPLNSNQRWWSVNSPEANIHLTTATVQNVWPTTRKGNSDISQMIRCKCIHGQFCKKQRSAKKGPINSRWLMCMQSLHLKAVFCGAGYFFATMAKKVAVNSKFHSFSLKDSLYK